MQRRHLCGHPEHTRTRRSDVCVSVCDVCVCAPLTAHHTESPTPAAQTPGNPESPPERVTFSDHTDTHFTCGFIRVLFQILTLHMYVCQDLVTGGSLSFLVQSGGAPSLTGSWRTHTGSEVTQRSEALCLVYVWKAESQKCCHILLLLVFLENGGRRHVTFDAIMYGGTVSMFISWNSSRHCMVMKSPARGDFTIPEHKSTRHVRTSNSPQVIARKIKSTLFYLPCCRTYPSCTGMAVVCVAPLSSTRPVARPLAKLQSIRLRWRAATNIINTWGNSSALPLWILIGWCSWAAAADWIRGEHGGLAQEEGGNVVMLEYEFSEFFSLRPWVPLSREKTSLLLNWNKL